MEVYVKAPQEKYGYFEFVHVPGAVVGDLKGMREAVSSSTQMFAYKVVFAVNPPNSPRNPPFEIVVSDNIGDASFLRRLLSSNEFKTNWFVNKRAVREQVFYEDVQFGRDPEQVMSRVLQEEIGRNFYKAYVHVDEGAWNEVCKTLREVNAKICETNAKEANATCEWREAKPKAASCAGASTSVLVTTKRGDKRVTLSCVHMLGLLFLLSLKAIERLQ